MVQRMPRILYFRFIPCSDLVGVPSLLNRGGVKSSLNRIKGVISHLARRLLATAWEFSGSFRAAGPWVY